MDIIQGTLHCFLEGPYSVIDFFELMRMVLIGLMHFLR